MTNIGVPQRSRARAHVTAVNCEEALTSEVFRREPPNKTTAIEQRLSQK
jgi:hypothetical protein